MCVDVLSDFEKVHSVQFFSVQHKAESGETVESMERDSALQLSRVEQQISICEERGQLPLQSPYVLKSLEMGSIVMGVGDGDGANVCRLIRIASLSMKQRDGNAMEHINTAPKAAAPVAGIEP